MSIHTYAVVLATLVAAIDSREDLNSSSSSSYERTNIRGDITSSGLLVIIRHRYNI